jgi:threonine aldolase
MMLCDYRSDTITKPTPAMLEAMQTAAVGDDVFGEDPTINALESKLAAILGKEAGLFCPSGTMTNQIAIKLHTRPGDEVICHRESHVYQYEGGGIAFNAGCSVSLWDGNRGMLTAAQVNAAVNNRNDVHKAYSRLVVLEDTSNRGGGAVYDYNEIVAIKDACQQHSLALHLDGARLFNALAVNGINPTAYAKPFDTISICLSKGLGCPVGSVLVGTKEQITAARRIRKVLGGGMRQAGYLAAAGIYALDHHIKRLHDDHSRAKTLQSALEKCAWVQEVFPVDTNIVVLRINNDLSETDIHAKLKDQGVLTIPFGPGLIRFVTHLDIHDNHIERTINTIEHLI